MTKILNEAILSPRSRSRLEMVKVLNQAGATECQLGIKLQRILYE
jgi:hypothetical protein